MCPEHGIELLAADLVTPEPGDRFEPALQTSELAVVGDENKKRVPGLHTAADLRERPVQSRPGRGILNFGRAVEVDVDGARDEPPETEHPEETRVSGGRVRSMRRRHRGRGYSASRAL